MLEKEAGALRKDAVRRFPTSGMPPPPSSSSFLNPSENLRCFERDTLKPKFTALVTVLGLSTFDI